MALSGMPAYFLIMNTASAHLSPEQAEHFREHGYCVVAGLFTEAEIDEIELFFEDYRANKEKSYDSTLNRSMHPHRHSERARDWFLNPNVAAVLEELLGKPALGAQTMYYYKPPGARGQGMHQDNFYLLSKPATCIAAWTAIDTADLDNGCLWVVPGSNHSDILCPGEGKENWNNYGDTHITKFPREQKPVPVIVPRGSTMFFSGNLIHGSGPNRTKDKSRRTFIGHYIDEASDAVAKFYHPLLNMAGEVVSDVAATNGGGPCGDHWNGALH
jgi:phytanoyl-CoA hydroxylase